MAESKLVTLQEIKDLHEKLGDKKLFEWLQNSDGASDIEAFRYIFKWKKATGMLRMMPNAANMMEKALDTMTLESMTRERYDHLGLMMQMAMEMFEDGVDVPDDMPPVRFVTHRENRRRKKKKHKNGGKN